MRPQRKRFVIRPEQPKVVRTCLARIENEIKVDHPAGPQYTHHLLEDIFRPRQVLKHGERVGDVEGRIGEAHRFSLHHPYIDSRETRSAKLTQKLVMVAPINAEQLAAGCLQSPLEAVSAEHSRVLQWREAEHHDICINADDPVASGEVHELSQELPRPDVEHIETFNRASVRVGKLRLEFAHTCKPRRDCAFRVAVNTA